MRKKKRFTTIFSVFALIVFSAIAPATQAFPSFISAQSGSAGIVGYGLGPDGPVVFVESADTVLPLSFEGYQVIVTGPIYSLNTLNYHGYTPPLTGRYRPAFPGVSIGNYRENAAGTLGAVVHDQISPMILSNNHVIANANNAVVGDPILQPGRLDGGVVGSDTIGILSRWVTIKFCNNDTCPENFVDAAVARITDSVVDPHPPCLMSGANLNQPVYKVEERLDIPPAT